MSDSLAIALGWGIVALALFSWLAVVGWAGERRKEREAYYRSEALKKIAEMQGTPSEPVLQLLREAVATWKQTPSMATMGPVQAKAYFRAESIKKIAEMQGLGAEAVTQYLREDERANARRVREGLKVGGMIVSGVGIALMAFLHATVDQPGVYLAGLFPLTVGVAMLVYVYALSPKEQDTIKM